METFVLTYGRDKKKAAKEAAMEAEKVKVQDEKNVKCSRSQR